MESQSSQNDDALRRAAEAIRDAEAMLICTGAGMGVGSGLGTFRGPNAGVWPPLKKLGLDFTEMSNPQWFFKDPQLGWSFWHFRYMSYTTAEPHTGYYLLKEWAASKPLGGFSFTSNIDGHWLRCGFPEDKVYEIHGSILYTQCAGVSLEKTLPECQEDIWPTPDDVMKAMVIDPETDRVTNEIPKCRNCGIVARPNVLMFDDLGYLPGRDDVQFENFRNWKKTVMEANANLVIVEIGAGKAVPTVRMQTEGMTRQFETVTAIRINPVESDAQFPDDIENGISIAMNGEEALQKIAEIMKEMK